MEDLGSDRSGAGGKSDDEGTDVDDESPEIEIPEAEAAVTTKIPEPPAVPVKPLIVIDHQSFRALINLGDQSMR